jgi:hypothetical protein
MNFKRLNIKFLGLIFFTFILFIFFFTLNFFKNDKLSIFKRCSLPKINLIPNNSIVVIGHAYGSPINVNNESYLSNKVQNFLNENRRKISKVIFTGDIFWEPSLKKWDRLYEDFKDDFSINIAPGNHEFDNLAKIDVLKLSQFRVEDFYEIKNIDKNLYLIENSIINNWELNNDMIKYINESVYDEFMIFRHNIPIIELVKLANSKSLMSDNLSSVLDIHKKFSKNKKITIISGDGGAFKELPRLTCYEYKNLKFIINGIGDYNNDKILILSKNNMHYYILKN